MKKLGNPISRHRYSTEERVQILRILKDNNYDIYKTSKSTGCKYGTIHQWMIKYKNSMENISAVEEIAENTERKLQRVKHDFITRHFDRVDKLGEEACRQAMELLKTEKDLQKVNGTIKLVNDFLSNNGKDEKDVEMMQPENAIQNMIARLNSIQNDSAQKKFEDVNVIE